MRRLIRAAIIPALFLMAAPAQSHTQPDPDEKMSYASGHYSHEGRNSQGRYEIWIFDIPGSKLEYRTTLDRDGMEINFSTVFNARDCDDNRNGVYDACNLTIMKKLQGDYRDHRILKFSQHFCECKNGSEVRGGIQLLTPHIDFVSGAFATDEQMKSVKIPNEEELRSLADYSERLVSWHARHNHLAKK